MINNHEKISRKWQEALSRNGGRITLPRQIILEVIAASQRPLTPQEVHKQAVNHLSSIGLVTVYRTIDKLVELGLIDRVHHSDQCQTVFRGTPGHQHLMICEACGRSEYFDGLKMEREFQKTAHKLGYIITGHWLQLNGLCPKCQKGK